MIFPRKKFFLALTVTTSLFVSTLFSQQAPPAENHSVVRVSDYTEFLNCVAATDTYGVYNPKMGEDAGIGSIITRSGKPGSYTYNYNPDRASFPVTYVSWISAVRYCNWKSHHGSIGLQDSTTTETGCYDLTAFDQGADITTVILTPGANFFLPTNDLIDTTFQDASTQSCNPYLASSRLGFCIGTWTSNSSANGTDGGNGSSNSTGASGVNGGGSSGNVAGSTSPSLSKARDITYGSSANSSTGNISTIMDASSNSNQINISLVQVGAPNNYADLSSTNNAKTNGYGAVLMPYQIGTYDVKASEYCAFLNAVAAKSDPHGLYNTNMTSDPDVACITRSGDAISGYTYTPIDGRKDFPITYVSWWAAVRFCNWLENGQPTGDQTVGITENGAFYMSTGHPVPGAAWSLPTEDQWYKAAYYIPSTNKNTSGTYCAFGTDSNDAPGNKWEEAAVANRANYSLNSTFTTQTQPRLTPAGSFTASASPWGAYDMAGEVNQWTCTFADTNESTLVFRGGSWNSQTSDELKSTARFTNSGIGSSTVGFRVVYNIPPAPIVTHLDMMKDLVTVGDPNNTADPDSTFGTVATVYQIEKYDVTAEQYCMFLNAVATHADPHALYNPQMATNPDVACLIRYGSTNRGYSYFTIPGREKFPITYVNWFAALRFCNWLENNQPIGDESPETTEGGSFDHDDQGVFTISTNNPKWLLPTEDQWYKAAYYQPAKDENSASYYYSFGTGSYQAPVNSLSAMANSANYCLNGVFTTPTQPRLTPVGTFTKTTSPCGAYDMAGDVSQWTLTPILSDPNSLVVRGGSWQSIGSPQAKNYSDLIYSNALFINATNSSSTIGFRVIYNVPPPPLTFSQTVGKIYQNVTKALWDDGKSLIDGKAATDQNTANNFFGYIYGGFIGGFYKQILSVLTLFFRNICLFFQQLLTAVLPDGMMETLNGWFSCFFNFFFKSLGVTSGTAEAAMTDAGIAVGPEFAELGLLNSIFTTAGEGALFTANPPLALAVMFTSIMTYAAYKDLQQSDPRMGMSYAAIDLGYFFSIIKLFL